MAQFAMSDATIAILTDDDDDEEDSSENEIFSKPDPEKESRLARRPIIGRRDRSHDRGDGQSDSSDGWQTANGRDFNNRKHLKRSESTKLTGSGNDSTESGSIGSQRASFFAISLVVLCLLVIAFPVHFPSVLLPAYEPTDVALRVTCCCAMCGTILSSLTSQLTTKMAASNYIRLSYFCACASVLTFAIIRCFRSAPVALFGCGSFLAGFLLVRARESALCEFRRPAIQPPLLDITVNTPQSRSNLDSTAYIACGLSTLVLSGLAPAISSSLYLTLLATYQTSQPTVNSSVTSFPVQVSTATWNPNVSVVANWASNDTVEDNTTVTISTAHSPSTTSYSSRLAALSVCFVVCSLGALLLTLCALDDGRRKSDKSSWSVSSIARLILEPLTVFTRQDVALLSLLAFYVGAQQLFAYFAYVHAFVPTEAGAHTPVMAGLCMAGTTVVVSGPVGYVLRYVGRVKFLLFAAIVMTSLLLILLLLDESRSRDPAAYYVIGCIWSVCDSCMQICYAAIVWLLWDISENVDGTSSSASQAALSSCYSAGQLLTFLLYSYLTSATSTLLCLLVVLPLATFGYLAVEIQLRLGVDDPSAAVSVAGGRRRYVTVRADDRGSTWLPRYDPLESPRKDRVKPLFDDRTATAPH